MDTSEVIDDILERSSIQDTTSEVIDHILEHHGVKGQKWGVRRKATVGPQQVIVRDSRVPGSKRLVTRGGRGHPAVPSAVRAREIGQISKKSGLKAISDDDLQTYAKRLQLEQNVKRLRYEDMNFGQRQSAKILGQAAGKTVQQGADAAAAKTGKRLLKLAAAAA